MLCGFIMPSAKSVLWQQSYEGQLRAAVGARQLILPGARAVIQDESGRVLFVMRRDNARWVMPAGALELNESVFDCLCREVAEETGLVVESATLIAVYSSPEFSFTTHYGNRVQMLSHVFRVDRWTGSLATETDETTDARFFATTELPEISDLYRFTLQDLEKFEGAVVLR